MPLAPVLVTVPVIVSGILWALRLGFSPEPFAPGSATLIASSLLAGSAVAAAGILIAHGRWSRRFALVVIGSEAILAIVMPATAWTWAGLAVVAAALIALTGPWLDGWLRRRPAAGGPGVAPMIVALSGVAVPGIVGAANPAGPALAHWVLAALAAVAGWGFGRAHGWGLWGVRILLPVAGLAAALVSPPVGALVIIAATGAAAAAAWTRESRLAVYPLFDTLPGPRRSRPEGAAEVTP